MGCRSGEEHLCKHETSWCLRGLQRNISSEQALNQLCLALGGAELCRRRAGLPLVAHDRVATSKFEQFRPLIHLCAAPRCEICARLSNTWHLLLIFCCYLRQICGLKCAGHASVLARGANFLVCNYENLHIYPADLQRPE